MGKIYESLAELIGHTPLLRLSRLAEQEGLQADVLAKLESWNPGGSVKDRPALQMIRAALASGELPAGGTIVEPTSGNTGIGLAWIGRTMGLRVVLTMPESMSVERRKLLKAYGAEIVLTPAAEGMQGAVSKAEALCRELPGAVVLGQFDNPENPRIHRETSGPEIWDDTAGAVDIFVAGVGSGGTLTGIGAYLKEQKPGVRVVAVEPAESPVLSGGRAGAHGIQGIGANFVPANFDPEIPDEIAQISTAEAVAAARLLAAAEGLLCGISGGAALAAALRLARRPDCEGKQIVALLPDGGERYLSTPLFD